MQDLLDQVSGNAEYGYDDITDERRYRQHERLEKLNFQIAQSQLEFTRKQTGLNLWIAMFILLTLVISGLNLALDYAEYRRDGLEISTEVPYPTATPIERPTQTPVQ